MRWNDIEIDTRPAEWDKSDFENYLNETYGEVDVCGYQHGAGTILKEIDPIAFNLAMGDIENPKIVYICPECDEEHDDEEDAKECCYCYECPECGQFYTNEEDARWCCEIPYEEED